jgi:hypothetical protein
MENIRRIGSTQASQAPRARDGRAVVASSNVETASPAQPRATAALGETGTNFRPAASFLAQYVDQHFPWPRAPLRKERQRQRATRAYIMADMLPDLLAETLRLRPVDRKL